MMELVFLKVKEVSARAIVCKEVTDGLLSLLKELRDVRALSECFKGVDREGY